MGGLTLWITVGVEHSMRGRRKRSVTRVKAAGVIPADVPRCCACGKPLLRLPACMGSSDGRVFQCADCFYPGTGRNPKQSSAVAFDRTRWWEEYADGGAPD